MSSYFIFPQSWIAPALSAAALAFGALDTSPTQIIYRNLDGEALGQSRPPATIVIDKRGTIQWTREKAQCVIVHEYAHLSGWQDSSNVADPAHSDNPRSIMNAVLRYKPCHRWLVRHGIK